MAYLCAAPGGVSLASQQQARGVPMRAAALTGPISATRPSVFRRTACLASVVPGGPVRAAFAARRACAPPARRVSVVAAAGAVPGASKGEFDNAAYPIYIFNTCVQVRAFRLLILQCRGRRCLFCIGPSTRRYRP